MGEIPAKKEKQAFSDNHHTPSQRVCVGGHLLARLGPDVVG